MTDRVSESAALEKRKLTRYQREPLPVHTSAGELIVELIPGARAYLWIGRRGQDGDEFLDTVNVRTILAAVERSKR